MNAVSRLTFRFKLYRSVFRLAFSLFGAWLLKAQRWQETRTDLKRLLVLENLNHGKRRIWFHAASVGELESLWPLVQKATQDEKLDLILTVFSSSAWGHVHRLA